VISGTLDTRTYTREQRMDEHTPTSADDDESAAQGRLWVQLYASRLHAQLCEILSDPAVPWPEKKLVLAIADHALRGREIPRNEHGIPDSAQLLAGYTDDALREAAEHWCSAALANAGPAQ
jgi:hypothetical protein